ncbi:putative phosphinothricin acetyltransferase YwnH [mine drainage metagenome]|uniref:Putative phosphinothricin acetyltransferase YwnH n=1 Tax=mine drainage metagenome TaxID=410659 RepID=A0A1J5SYM1_9ZZZZ
MTIRRLKPNDASACRALRLLGLRQSPASFGRSHREEASRPLSFFEERLAPTGPAATFGAFAGGELVGMITLLRAPGLKENHKASIVGLYVHPEHRRQGVARRLVARALRAASGLDGVRQLRVAVVEENAPALALYEEAGFSIYGREPEALHHRGRFLDELLLARLASTPRRG